MMTIAFYFNFRKARELSTEHLQTKNYFRCDDCWFAQKIKNRFSP